MLPTRWPTQIQAVWCIIDILNNEKYGIKGYFFRYLKCTTESATNLFKSLLDVLVDCLLIYLIKLDILFADRIQGQQPHRQLHMTEFRTPPEHISYWLVELGDALELDRKLTLPDRYCKAKGGRWGLGFENITWLGGWIVPHQLGSVFSAKGRLFFGEGASILLPAATPLMHGLIQVFLIIIWLKEEDNGIFSNTKSSNTLSIFLD